MARRPDGTDPAYRHHKTSNRALVSLPLGNGRYHDVYLGDYGTEESRREYDRVLAEWKATRAAEAARSGSVSIAELLAAFLEWAKSYYRKGEARTSEYDTFVLALRPVLHLYGDLPVCDFRPNMLRAVRELMIHGYKHPRHDEQAKLARSVINGRIRRIRQVFRWGVGREMVRPEVLVALQAVEVLERGRSAARETARVEAVPVELVEKTLPHLPPPVAAMVRVQLLTGMRPGEVVQMRAANITPHPTDPALKVYTPATHKTEHHAHTRAIVLGPQTLAVLAPWLARAEADGLPVFSPAREAEDRYARMRATRKTRVQPSQKCRRKARPKRKPAAAYSTNSYAGAIRRACAAHGLRSWHPHQLRHTHAEVVRKKFGLDHVQASLGHSTQAMSERYASLDLTFATDVARQLG